MKTTENTSTPEMRGEKLPGAGGYRGLRTFQLATIIYDATVAFCGRFIDRTSRTHDRMVQTAHSGRQNIVRGSRPGADDRTAKINFNNAARISLDELLLDYEDFLRQRKLRAWVKDDSDARAVRTVVLEREHSEALAPPAYATWLEHKDPAVVANALICLIHQTDHLLVSQGVGVQGRCISQGGALPAPERSAGKKDTQSSTVSPDRPEPPACKMCGRPMALRTVKQGKNEGRSFWGCTGYPECKATAPLKTRFKPQPVNETIRST